MRPNRQLSHAEQNGQHGFLFQEIAPQHEATHRQLSVFAVDAGRGGPTTAQTTGRGATSLFHNNGVELGGRAADIATLHARAAQNHFAQGMNTTYVAAHLDAHGRPESVLGVLNQGHGSHDRRGMPTDLTARYGDDRGHGLPQAQTIMPSNLEEHLMVSQSPDQNRAIQWAAERAAHTIDPRRRVLFEVHNEFPTELQPPGELPRPTHQTFTVVSTDENGLSPMLHFSLRTSQR